MIHGVRDQHERMRIISFNANGIRSAARKGFFDWLPDQDADLVCIQETKARFEQLGDPVFRPAGYHCYYRDAEKKGYSGVAIYSRSCPDQVHYRFGLPEIDREGRYLELRFDGLSVVSLYLPSGSSGDLRQQFKLDLLGRFKSWLRGRLASGRPHVVCGDWNIAHTAADIRNARGNRGNSGFTPAERAWMDWLVRYLGWRDAFRCIEQAPEQYTWWSNRGQAFAKNVGWRIDYQMVTPELGQRVLATRIERQPRFSDHAPLIVDYAAPR